MFNNDMTEAEARQALSLLGIHDGMQVAAGQVIAQSVTRECQRRHLHFSVYVNGETVDPGIFNYTTSNQPGQPCWHPSLRCGCQWQRLYPQMLTTGSQGSR